MRKRMLAYLAYVDALLANPPEGVDYENEIRLHLIQIGFFMHERLIHLIVTVVFAILTVAAILYAAVVPGVPQLALIAAFMVLLIPYIRHYYLLENGVQRMYAQYDALREKSAACRQKTFSMERNDA